MTTRAQIETTISRRCGPLLALAGMTAIVQPGDDLASPIAWAVRQLGGATADPTQPTAAEIAAISSADALFDLTELAALESALTRYTGVNQTSQGESSENDQIRAALTNAVDRKRALIERTYGTQAATLTAGVIGLSFQETYADA